MPRKVNPPTDEKSRVAALKRMLTIREFERTVGRYFADGMIPGSVHLCLGQEAVAVGGCAALENRDMITSTHRGHGHCIAMGLDPEKMFAELFGYESGYCQGKGGSMHVAATKHGMLGANGIVAAGIPIATGAALATDLNSENQVVLSFTGDGSLAQGQFHEAINLAAVWDLPVIFLIENNQYSEMTPTEEQLNIDNLSNIAGSYDIIGNQVDGMDVRSVYNAVRNARNQAITNKGPTIIEAETYRYRGHFEGDPENYREEAEIREWQSERDPIKTYKSRLVRNNDISKERFQKINSEVEQIIDEAVQSALSGSPAPAETAYSHVFAEPPSEISYYYNRLEKEANRSKRLRENEQPSRPSR